jgi:hypothetical protein
MLHSLLRHIYMAQFLFTGRRNPLRMLSNAIDFRARRKQRPKSADFESVEEGDGGKARSRQSAKQAGGGGGGTLRSASVTDILETVTALDGPAALPRPLEGRNSAPDLLPGLLLDPKERQELRIQMYLLTIKIPNTRCRLYRCIIEFVDRRYMF